MAIIQYNSNQNHNRYILENDKLILKRVWNWKWLKLSKKILKEQKEQSWRDLYSQLQKFLNL